MNLKLRTRRDGSFAVLDSAGNAIDGVVGVEVFYRAGIPPLANITIKTQANIAIDIDAAVEEQPPAPIADAVEGKRGSKPKSSD